MESGIHGAGRTGLERGPNTAFLCGGKWIRRVRRVAESSYLDGGSLLFCMAGVCRRRPVGPVWSTSQKVGVGEKAGRQDVIESLGVDVLRLYTAEVPGDGPV